MGRNRFAMSHRNQKELVRRWVTQTNAWDEHSTLDLGTFTSFYKSGLSSDAMIIGQPGRYLFLGNMGELWFQFQDLGFMYPMPINNTVSRPQDDCDHNMNLNNTEAVFRWCDPTGFWEWGQATGLRKIPVAIPWANFHCWYLGRGELGRAVVLANDYLMVIDATYGLDNAGALKV